MCIKAQGGCCRSGAIACASRDSQPLWHVKTWNCHHFARQTGEHIFMSRESCDRQPRLVLLKGIL